MINGVYKRVGDYGFVAMARNLWQSLAFAKKKHIVEGLVELHHMLGCQQSQGNFSDTPPSTKIRTISEKA